MYKKNVKAAGGPDKQKKIRGKSKTAIIFLSLTLNICFGCSKEPSH